MEPSGKPLRGSGSQYHRRPGFLGPAADDETLRSAYPWGGRASERGALSDLRMALGSTEETVQALELTDFMRQMFLSNL